MLFAPLRSQIVANFRKSWGGDTYEQLLRIQCVCSFLFEFVNDAADAVG